MAQTPWPDLPADAELILEPIAPAADAGAASFPLAGGPQHFALLRVIAGDGRRRLAEETVPASRIEGWAASLPEPLAARFRQRFDALTRPRAPIALAGLDRPLTWGRPLIMGIVNVTPDSFSEGGRFADPEAAVAHGRALAAAGADILDIGGESTRPGAAIVWEEEERRRVLPVIEGLTGLGVPLSIDSRKAGVMAAALDAGAHLVNDVSALAYDPDSLALVAERGVPAVLMHSRGDPATMQRDPRYEDVVVEVFDELAERVEACEAAGIARERLILDPGIGFGKTVRHNLEIIDGIGALHGLGCPLLLGVSRKRFIGALSREEPADRRLPGSLAAALTGLARGVQILRVHDVAETVQALAVRQGLLDVAVLRHFTG